MSHDVHTLSGAYAVDALDPEEAEAFRRHLADCAACRDEVNELRRAAAELGAAEATAPPEGLRDRVLAAVDLTPQEPPRVPSRPPADPGVTPLDRRRRWVVRLMSVAAAAVLVAAGVIGLSTLFDDDRPALSAAAEAVFEADDARTRTVSSRNGGWVVIGASPSRDEMAIDTRNLPELDSAHVYQLWTIHDGQMTSAAVLHDADAGAAMELPERSTEVALTVEPESGSDQPTTEPVVLIDPAQL